MVESREIDLIGERSRDAPDTAVIASMPVDSPVFTLNRTVMFCE
jgi:hypothetical protein